ncbi:MAG: PilN domain-containing protein [Candidatus Woesebacteria bacterium]
MAYKPQTLVIPKINLIPRDPFYETTIGKIMVWAIQVGRYIIIFTEIIVIMSFASRFKLDRDLTDLTAKVTQKKAIVESFGDIEARTRTIQDKIATTQKLLADGTAMFYLDKVTARIPSGIELTQLTLDPGTLTFSGKAVNSNVLAAMIVALQQEPAFTSVSVDKISSGQANDPNVSFAIKLTIPQKAVEAKVEDGSTPTTPPTSPDTPVTP